MALRGFIAGVPVCLLFVAAILAQEPKTKHQVAGSLLPYIEKQQLAGAVVAVADGEQVHCIEAVGWADVAAKKPMRADAMFWIASMTKPITATALMMLVDEGKVKLEEPIATYLPDFEGQMYVAEQTDEQVVLKKPKRGATVRELLSHTSGMMSRSPVSTKLDSVPLATAVASYSIGPTNFAPGTEWEYNNPGINTAGRIIEVVSGMPYEEFLQRRIFDPLGMKDTTFFPSEAQILRLAKSYAATDGGQGIQAVPLNQFTQPLDAPQRYPSPAGGLFSTAGDVAKFCQMLLNQGRHGDVRLLSEDSLRKISATQTSHLLSFGGSESGYGLGFATMKRSQGAKGPVLAGEFGHGGAYHTNMWIDPERNLVTVFMIQHVDLPGVDGEEVLDAFRNAAREKFGKKQP